MLEACDRQPLRNLHLRFALFDRFERFLDEHVADARTGIRSAEKRSKLASVQPPCCAPRTCRSHA
eukprot:7380107-Prymnesium_polylepis.5